jgi:O-antigen/teichoic acid export membrane protein
VSRRLLRLAGSIGGAVVVPFVTAAGSLALQVLAARALGGAGYGAYTLFTGTLIMIIALHTSWVGDALTVFDRFAAGPRAAIAASMPVTIAVGAGVGLAVAATAGGVGPGTLGLYLLLIVLTLLSETTRRIYMARQEFWALVGNDCVNYGVTLAMAAGLVLRGWEPSVGLLLGAMCFGQVAGVGLARLRLPGREFRPGGLRGAAIREVFGFGFWRSVHASLRPASTLVSRLMIVGFASTAVLGGIEAARLLLSPAVTVVVGSGGYLLSRFAQAAKQGRPAGAGQALRMALALAGVTLVLSAVGIGLAGPLGPVITGGDFAVDEIALYGWAVWAFSFALTMPLAVLGTSRKRSRLVSAIRGAESALGLAALAVVLAVDARWASYAPFCLGAGGLVSSAVLWHLLRRDDRRRLGGLGFAGGPPGLAVPGDQPHGDGAGHRPDDRPGHGDRGQAEHLQGRGQQDQRQDPADQAAGGA